jgi:flagellar biosynthesis/type III secretory pathway chaperone
MSADAQVGNAAEAERAVATLNDAIDRLTEVLAQETELLRKGRVRDAAALEAQKQSFAACYSAAAARVKLAGPLIARALPQALEPLRKRHSEMQALLQKNMTVLATAHGVSEGIIRGVSGELARRRNPSTYGATGRANAPGPRTGQPIAVSKAL